MKKIMMVLMTVFVTTVSYESKAQDNSGINFNTFYSQLSPYGRWVNNADYGQVWIANADGFEPYSNNGHWVFTNYGWTWVSDYAWGWAPFHYGRWAYIQSFGWAWIPGYEWAPAWVNWCQYDDYYGWAPMGPGMGFNMGFGGIPYNHWRFVRHQYINSPYVYRHYQRPAIKSNAYNQVTIINNTQLNNNVTYAAGPAQQEVERVTRKKITPKQVSFTVESAGKTAVVANEVRIFRPGIRTNTTSPAGTIKQAVKQQPVEATETGNGVQPVKPVLVKPQTKEPITKQPGELKNEVQPGADPQPEPVRQQQPENIKKAEELVKPAQPTEQYNQQQADLKKQQELIRQQQLKEQQAAEQQNMQQQAAARRQQQQNDIRQQQIRQEQIRQQQRQNEIRQQKAQQQPVRKEVTEEKPVQQPARSKTPPAKPTRKD